MERHIVESPERGGIHGVESILTISPPHWANSRIPADILGEIFLHCLPEKATPLAGDSFTTPGFWVDLFIVSYSSFRTEDAIPLGKFVLALVKEWFLRARTVKPLLLGLARIRDRPTFWKLVDEVILPYSSRWRRLQLHSS